jgi:hypothetical protein
VVPFTFTLTGIVTEPPLSFPITVRVALKVCVNAEFGTKRKRRPRLTCAVVEETSPMKVGMVAVVTF